MMKITKMMNLKKKKMKKQTTRRMKKLTKKRMKMSQKMKVKVMETKIIDSHSYSDYYYYIHTFFILFLEKNE